MCSRYGEAECCICHRHLGQSNNRIIVEICGHQKCRECFIKEEDGCSVCSKNAIQHQNDTHLAIPSSSSDHIQTEESRQNAELNEIASHIITTTTSDNELRYQCTICQKCFKSRNNCKYHLFCDKTRTKPFQCNQCDKQFITHAHMNYHQSTHSNDKQFACSHCQKVYSGEIALKKHLRKHQNDFKYQCTQCNEKFLYKEQLNIHQNRHNNVFHKCPECGKRFLIKSNLTKHIQSHTGVNRKICPICKNSFSGNSALKTHLLTHSKSKSHQCEKCSKKFIDQRTLERHWKTHTENQFYECTLCSAKSGRKDNIRRHVRNLHSETDDELRSILEKIFDNYDRKKNGLVVKSTKVREEKTESEKPTNDQDNVPEANEMSERVEEANSAPSPVLNIATSVIKFVGRSQDIQPHREESLNRVQSSIVLNQETSLTEQCNENLVERKLSESNSNETVDGPTDPIAEIGVNLPSLEPLNFDPYPDIAPLPLLNTNTNLTVYRQLLSPYLKKPTNSNDESSHNSSKESNEIATNKQIHASSTQTTAMVIDRPPKKMIEKYEIYRN